VCDVVVRIVEDRALMCISLMCNFSQCNVTSCEYDGLACMNRRDEVIPPGPEADEFQLPEVVSRTSC